MNIHTEYGIREYMIKRILSGFIVSDSQNNAFFLRGDKTVYICDCGDGYTNHWMYEIIHPLTHTHTWIHIKNGKTEYSM